MTTRSTKRINGDYHIYVPTMTIHGNLDVIGTTTTIETTNTAISDATIVLNQNEVGAGVTAVYSGIEVERGSLTNVGLRWNESLVKWQLTTDGSAWNEIATGGATISGANTQVQFNDEMNFGGDPDFTWDKNTNTLMVTNISLSGSTISTVATNKDLTLDPNGSGRLIVNAAMKLADQGSDPVASASNNFVYSKTPAAGGSGVFFVNTTYSDELVSKKKARKFALIF